jgi:hypothetical protein
MINVKSTPKYGDQRYRIEGNFSKDQRLRTLDFAKNFSLLKPYLTNKLTNRQIAILKVIRLKVFRIIRRRNYHEN